uniref:Gasdermin pore forming domain-containing protein n=1 Tax=Salmo trutta TaxID=8032 RepID=A0A674CCK5_SALTR
MFAKATKAFVKDTDHEGCLIPVSSLNDTDKLNLRSLIVKTRHRCFWQEPKYQSPGFTLGDVLNIESIQMLNIPSAVKESDFVDYSGIFGDKKEMNADESVEAKLADFNITVGGKWSTKQKLSLGITLYCTYVQYSHNTVTIQSQYKSGSSVHQTSLTNFKCFPQASMKQSGSTQTESDVSLGIPANTVMAYSLIELYVKCNGTFELCLIRNNGGFEKVWSKDEIEEDGIVDLRGDFVPNSPLNLNEGNNASGG